MSDIKKAWKQAFRAARLGENNSPMPLDVKARKCAVGSFWNDTRELEPSKAKFNTLYRYIVKFGCRGHELQGRNLIIHGRATPIFSY